ncbi:MAG: hypothetical protein ACLQQ4_11570 [Bacteroidia bacterium]
MYKITIIGGLICAVFSLNSCKQNSNTEAEAEAPLAAGMIRIDLTTEGVPATIDMPDTTQHAHVIETLPSGEVHITLDRWFNITVNVSGMNMDRKKKDIAGDDVDKFQSWVVQDSSSILYKTQMVNEEYHFYAIIKKGGKTFYAQDHSQGADGNVTYFSEPQIQAMLTAAKTLTPVKPAARAAKS